ncbi:hypothetical protein HaLaN_10883 [Haematococcus lacustris]|uniref:Uncharacterized protein n=1 Tax=Haematococcus lacustris TaxID=44745 RepID=A0A699Z6L3_HAELA|nr:hypothetical protein HaLaN_10883 [Haematococcus lacustris]
MGGRHSCTMSMCNGYTPHSPSTPLESGDYCPLVARFLPVRNPRGRLLPPARGGGAGMGSCGRGP